MNVELTALGGLGSRCHRVEAFVGVSSGVHHTDVGFILSLHVTETVTGAVL